MENMNDWYVLYTMNDLPTAYLTLFNEVTLLKDKFSHRLK